MNAKLMRKQLAMMYIEGQKASLPRPFSLCFHFKITGSCDLGILQESLSQLRSEYPLLTCRAKDRADGAYGLEPMGQQGVPVASVTSEAGALALIEDEFKRPLLLAHSELCRIRIFTSQTGEVFVSFAVHHAIFDGSSIDLLSTRLWAIYASHVVGKGENLPPSMEFFRHMQSADRELTEEQQAFWLERLQGYHGDLELPKSTLPALAQEPLIFDVPLVPDQLRAIQKWCKEQGVSSFVWGLSVYKIFCWLLSGKDQIGIGTPLENRDLDSADDLGYYSNFLPIITKWATDETFGSLCQKVQEEILNVMDAQNASFAELVKLWNPAQDQRDYPLIQAGFASRDHTKDAWDVARLHIELVREPMPVQFELMGEWIEDKHQSSFRLIFHPALFRPETCSAWSQLFAAILAYCVERPLALLRAFAPFDSASWNNLTGLDVHEALASKPVVRPIDQIMESCRTLGSKTALFDGRNTLNFSQLGERITQGSQVIREATTTGRVAVLLPRSMNYVVASLSVWNAGSILVPLSLHLPQQRMNHILSLSEADVVITDEKTIKKNPWLEERSYVLVDALAGSMERHGQASSVTAGTAVASPFASMIFTSGSTGIPKGVCLTHESITHFAEWYGKQLGIDSTSIGCGLADIGFDCSTIDLACFLNRGAALSIVDDESRANLPELKSTLIERGVTIVFAPTSLGIELLNLNWPQSGPLQALVVAGEKFVPNSMKGYPFKVMNMYGPTEATIAATYQVMQPLADIRNPASLGRPIPGYTIYILDVEGRPVPIGTPGEIYIGGVGVALGYEKGDEAQQKAFAPDPWIPSGLLYRTGDFGLWEPDHSLTYLGRRDHQVKISGYRVELSEIEVALKKWPGIQNVYCLFDRPREEARKSLVCFYTNAGPAIDREVLSRHLESLLPDYMIPHDFYKVIEIPRSVNGKTDRKALVRLWAQLQKPAKAANGQDFQAYGACAGEFLKVLSEHTSAPLLADKNLIQLGLRSLDIMKISRVFEKQTGIRLRTRTLFANLAAILAELQASGAHHV